MIHCVKTCNGLLVTCSPNLAEAEVGDATVATRWHSRAFATPERAMAYMKDLAERDVPSQRAFASLQPQSIRALVLGAVAAAAYREPGPDGKKYAADLVMLMDRMVSEADSRPVPFPAEEEWICHMVDGGGWAVIHESEVSLAEPHQERSSENTETAANAYVFESTESMVSWLGRKIINLSFEE